MAHDLIKFALALAALIVIAGVVAMFVSGYLTAYKPGDKSVQAQQSAVIGGKTVRSAAATATPKPAMARPQYPQNQPFMMPQPPEMPPAGMETGAMSGVEMPAQEPSAAPLPSGTTAPSAVTSPSTPSMDIWNYIFQDLLRIFPGLFTGTQRAFPQWPVGWFKLL